MRWQSSGAADVATDKRCIKVSEAPRSTDRPTDQASVYFRAKGSLSLSREAHQHHHHHHRQSFSTDRPGCDFHLAQRFHFHSWLPKLRHRTGTLETCAAVASSTSPVVGRSCTNLCNLPVEQHGRKGTLQALELLSSSTDGLYLHRSWSNEQGRNVSPRGTCEPYQQVPARGRINMGRLTEA